MKLQRYCTAKETIKTKRQPSEWETIFANESMEKKKEKNKRKRKSY